MGGRKRIGFIIPTHGSETYDANHVWPKLCQHCVRTTALTNTVFQLLMRIVWPSITKAACQRLLRSRRYTRTSPSSIRCVSSRSCRMSCSSPQHYGRAHQQVYGSVCLVCSPALGRDLQGGLFAVHIYCRMWTVQLGDCLICHLPYQLFI